jgi:hypothetical protein
MTTLQITVANFLTGETIVREMNEAELAQYKIDQDESKANAQARADQAVAREALLDRLGITADEAQLLLGA